MRYFLIFQHAVFVVALLAMPWAGAEPNNAPSQQRLYPNEQPITFTTMDGQTTDAFSGFINVPENRNNSASRSIKVHYVRFPATTEDSTTPIIYLAGGPGGSGINTAKYPNFRFPLFMAMREFGDVIALDQRGTGLSDDLPECRSQQHLNVTTEQTEAQVTQLYRAAAIECADFWAQQGIDIKGYNTLESAHDLNDLREHFNTPKMTLWGISYGSHLAFAAMKAYPEQIQQVVIASAEGLDQTVKLPARTDAYFARLQAAINTQEKARELYPDIVTMMHRVHEKLAKNPLTVTYDNDSGKQTLLFQEQHLQFLAAGMIADPHRSVPLLLRLYRTLDQGDVAAQTNLLSEVLKRGYFDDTQISFRAMPMAMDIASGISKERLQLVKEQAKTSLLGLALNFPMPQLNEAIPEVTLGNDFRVNPTNAIPTLLLTGTLDGRTYPDGQLEATSGLSRLTHVTVVNAGHNLFMRSPKVTEVIKSFLANGAVAEQEIVIDLPDFAPW